MQIFIDLIRFHGHLTFTSGLHGFIYFFSNIISLIFVIMYLHQFFYLIFGTFRKYKIKEKEFKLHTYGIVISARNESKVIGNLIKSIQANDYPKELYHIFVIADNCTDNTADICRELGCIVFERNDTTKIGKGYALNYLFNRLHGESQFAPIVPDAYIVLDADNIIKPNFITEMNKVYDSGYEMVTSYRNTKNFGKNWITSGYGYWFLHEAKHLNNSRMALHTSCAISGTGFLISTDVVKEYDNWSFFTLTEDIQCSTEYAMTKRNIGYCGSAELYDEQPETFRQSWRQRERWAKGFYQVFGKDGKQLIGKALTNFSCWDILTTIFPALIITMLLIISLPISSIVGLCIGDYFSAVYAWKCLGLNFLYLYIIMFVIALLVLITEGKKIKTTWPRKILHLFTFPFFMFTYIPIAISAAFKKVEWKPIVHSADISIDEIEKVSNDKGVKDKASEDKTSKEKTSKNKPSENEESKETNLDNEN